MGSAIGLITARGGSKGVPRKNIRMLAGKPMIAWTIQAAQKSCLLSRTIVSTNDEEIARVAQEFGAEVPFRRPEELATDGVSHVDVVSHALSWLEQSPAGLPEYIVLLQPTSPLRIGKDIDSAISIARNHRARAVISVCEPFQHPFVMKRLLPTGAMVDLLPSGLAYARRQDFPKVYAMNGAIYLAQPSVVLSERTLEPADALPCVMPSERSLEIDTLWDFEVAGLIMESGLGQAISE